VAASNLIRVVLWMVGALLSFCMMAVGIRSLALQGFSLFEILGLRSATAVLLLVGATLVRPQLRASTRPRQMKLHLFRNVIHYIAQYAWATGLTLLPLATVFSLEFTMPGWTALLAVWLLGEKLTPSRIGVVILGIVGAAVILRPGIASIDPAAFIVLGAALGLAIVMIATKQLTKTESTFAIVFWMSLIQLPLSLIGSVIAGTPAAFLDIQATAILPILGLGIGGTTSHYCFSNAFRAGGDAMLVVPLDFMRVPLIAVIGWALYDESLDVFVFLGALIIMAGVMWNLHSEARTKPLPPLVAE
jgi:drug/metabolite transporter (DMT)-like permease